MRDIFKPYQRPQGVHCGRIARQSIALNFTHANTNKNTTTKYTCDTGHARTRGTTHKKNMCGGGTVASAAAPMNRILPAAAAPRAPTIDIQTRQARNIVQDPRGCRRTLHTKVFSNDALQCSAAALRGQSRGSIKTSRATYTCSQHHRTTEGASLQYVSNRGSTCRADPISRHMSHTPPSACTQRIQIRIQLQSIPRSPFRRAFVAFLCVCTSVPAMSWG